MGSITTNLKIPYPTGTDRVADGDNAMQAIAEKLDRFAIGYTAYSAGFAIATSTFLPLNVPENLGLDVGNAYDPATGIWTCPLTGLYLVAGNITFGTLPVAGTHRLLTSWVAGPTGSLLENGRAAAPVQAGSQGVSLASPRTFNAGDRQQFQVYQDSGSTAVLPTVNIGVILLLPFGSGIA